MISSLLLGILRPSIVPRKLAPVLPAAVPCGQPFVVPRRRTFVRHLHGGRDDDVVVGNGNGHVRSSLSLSIFLILVATCCLMLFSSRSTNAAALYSSTSCSTPTFIRRPQRSPSLIRRMRRYYDSPHSSAIEEFTGPVIIDTDETTSLGLLCNIELVELGLVLSVAPSTVAVGTLGLFCRISDDVNETTIPAMTLLAGYAKGNFHDDDHGGDKTVRFAITSHDAPVFYNRQLMTIEQAIATVVSSTTEEIKLFGHDIYYDDENNCMAFMPKGSNNSNDRNDTTDVPPLSFARYFVPSTIINVDDEINITNLGQYCNDRAFVTGIDHVEYERRCETENCIRLIWRLEYDETAKQLRPSWPVSILSRDMKFSNREPIELGTTYGWNYWNASIELDRL